MAKWYLTPPMPGETAMHCLERTIHDENLILAEQEQAQLKQEGQAGYTSTLSGDLNAQGNRVYGLPVQPATDTDAVSLAFLKSPATLYTEGDRFETKKRIAHLPAQDPGESVTLAQLQQFLGVSGSGFVTLHTPQTITARKTFLTDLVCPLIIGGVTPSSSLTLKSTEAVGTTDYVRIVTGNNGSNEALRATTDGRIGLNRAVPVYQLDIAGGTAAGANILRLSSTLDTALNWHTGPAGTPLDWLWQLMAADGRMRLYDATDALEVFSAFRNGHVSIGPGADTGYRLGLSGQDTLLYLNALNPYCLWQTTAAGTAYWYMREDSAAGRMDLTSATATALTALQGGNIGLFNNFTPTSKLDINDNRVRIRTAFTPATSAAAGNQGDIAWDASFLYVAVATNSWRRIALTTF